MVFQSYNFFIASSSLCMLRFYIPDMFFLRNSLVEKFLIFSIDFFGFYNFFTLAISKGIDIGC